MTELSIRIVVLLTLSLTALPGFAAIDETALLQKLQRAEQQAATPATRQWLQELLNYQELARKPHPERASLSLPRHDIAARARALLRRWDEQTAFEQLLAQPQKQLKNLKPDIARAARKRWIAQASQSQLRDFQQHARIQDMAEDVLLSLALALPAVKQDQELARRGQSPATLNYLQQRLQSQQIDVAQQSRVLDLLRQNPALQGAMPALQAEWLNQHPTQKQAFLSDWKQNWSTDTVATLLRLQPADISQQLRSALNDADKAPLAAWALWQLNTPSARQALADYGDSPAAIPHLAQEIRTWLR